MENLEQYQILILDDHPAVLSGVSLIVGQIKNVICHTASDTAELHSQLQERSYDLLILDLELPDIDGFQVIGYIKNTYPNCKILVYSMHEEPWIMANLVPYNIDGVLSKNSRTEDLTNAVKSIISGNKTYTDAYMRVLNHSNNTITKVNSIELSHREKEVLAFISQGYTTREIAEMIYLSVNTVSTYRKRLMTKLQARNVADLVIKGKSLIFNPLPPPKKRVRLNNRRTL